MKNMVVDRGAELILEERDPLSILVSFANHTFHHDRKNREAFEKVLAVSALSASWQKSFQDLKASCG